MFQIDWGDDDMVKRTLLVVWDAGDEEGWGVMGEDSVP
jgi:hypothetical protein